MKKFIFPGQLNKISLLILFLGLGIGLFTSAQWKTKPVRVTNPVIPYVSLEETSSSLILDQENLKKQINDLQEKINQDQENLKKQAANRVKAEQVQKYREEIGLSEIKGSGIVITLDDSKIVKENSDAITHAADLRDIVNFLFGLGAEAISINNERVVLTTSIDCFVNTILINNTRTVPPFVINAIGDSNSLASALRNGENLADLHKRIRTEGLIFEIKEEREIIVPKYNGSFIFSYTRESK